MSQYDRYNMQRTITVRANIMGEELSKTALRVAAGVKQLGSPPARVSVSLRGEMAPMKEILSGVERGLLVAAGAVFLLLAAYFQSSRLSLIAISTIPGALAGVALALWFTRTTLNLQSLMGAIMAVGVAMANAILLVTFAERSRMNGATAAEAAIEGARTRLRPILMTSMTMITGMLPVAIGLSDRSGQLAPLACAMVGGLFAATVATLFVLPSIFAWGQRNMHRRGCSIDTSDGLTFEP